MKNKIFVFINVFGLAIAMACCIVAYLCYDFNTGFDHIHKKASTVYRVSSWREFQHQKTKYGHVPMGLGNVVAQNINDIENVIRYSPGDGNFRINQDLVNIGIKFVDTAFFQTFTFNFIQGNGSLTDHNNLVISEGLARRFFGNEFALGKSIEQLLGSLYEANRVNNNILKMSGFLGIVTFILSVTSLFTLLSLNINRRMKEIGVRKVLGASMANLSWVLNKEFLRTLLVACVVGILLGEFLVDDLLSELWKYHQEVTLLTLSSSLVVQLTGSVLSIGYKVYTTTRLNPSDVLRDE